MFVIMFVEMEKFNRKLIFKIFIVVAAFFSGLGVSIFYLVKQARKDDFTRLTISTKVKDRCPCREAQPLSPAT